MIAYGVVAMAGFAVVVGACGADNNDTLYQSAPAGGSAGAAGTDPGNGGSAGAIMVDSGRDVMLFDQANQPDTTCSASEATATRVPADIVILLDKSGSMTYTDASGKAKYDAVKEALNAFLTDPKSADLGVGMQFFPLNKPGVPSACTASSQCGSGGPCTTGVCLASVIPCDGCDSTPSEQWQGCNTDSQCPSAWITDCTSLGVTGDGQYLCFYEYQTDCYLLQEDMCINALSCDQGQYAGLNVPVQPIATSGPQISAAMDAIVPEGSTPTYPALSGAIAAAQANEAANPTHTTLVLFATDGLPTACDPTAIPQIAAVAAGAANGTPSIKTFVIGIFTQDDMSQGDPQSNLDQIAVAGGTTQATIIAASTTDVVSAFLAKLEEIRGQALACDYAIPPSPDGKPLDYEAVEVVYTPSGGAPGNLPYVDGANQCGANGGWHYDDNANPTKIVLCPASCDTIKGDPNPKVNFALGCKRQGPA